MTAQDEIDARLHAVLPPRPVLQADVALDSIHADFDRSASFTDMKEGTH